MKRLSKYKGRWTSDSTDLVLAILNIYHVYYDGSMKVKYVLSNKRNGIFYEKGSSKKLNSEFFEINYRLGLYE